MKISKIQSGSMSAARVITLTGLLLAVVLATPQARAQSSRPGAGTRTSVSQLSTGGQRVTKTWQLASGVTGRHVLDFDRDGHKVGSFRTTLGRGGRSTTTGTRYAADGRVTSRFRATLRPGDGSKGSRATSMGTRYGLDGQAAERWQKKTWSANGVLFEHKTRSDGAGNRLHTTRSARGRRGGTYLRETDHVVGTSQTTKQWNAKQTRFTHQTTRYPKGTGLRPTHRRWGVGIGR